MIERQDNKEMSATLIVFPISGGLHWQRRIQGERLGGSDPVSDQVVRPEVFTVLIKIKIVNRTIAIKWLKLVLHFTT